MIRRVVTAAALAVGLIAGPGVAAAAAAPSQGAVVNVPTQSQSPCPSGEYQDPNTGVCFVCEGSGPCLSNNSSSNNGPISLPDASTIGNMLQTGTLSVKMYQCLTGDNNGCIETTLELLGVTLPQSQAEQIRNLLRANLVAACGDGIIAALPTGGSTVAACGPLALEAFIGALTPTIAYSN